MQQRLPFVHLHRPQQVRPTATAQVHYMPLLPLVAFNIHPECILSTGPSPGESCTVLAFCNYISTPSTKFKANPYEEIAFYKATAGHKLLATAIAQQIKILTDPPVVS